MSDNVSDFTASEQRSPHATHVRLGFGSSVFGIVRSTPLVHSSLRSPADVPGPVARASVRHGLQEEENQSFQTEEKEGVHRRGHRKTPTVLRAGR